MDKNGKKWPFLPKVIILSVFGLYLPNAAINFQKYTLYAGKILIWRIFGHGIAKFCPLKADFRVLGL